MEGPAGRLAGFSVLRPVPHLSRSRTALASVCLPHEQRSLVAGGRPAPARRPPWVGLVGAAIAILISEGSFASGILLRRAVSL